MHFLTIYFFLGHADVVLAVGFEKMKGGSLESMENTDDRTHALERHIDVISSTNGLVPVPLMAQIFANAGREHMNKYGNLLARNYLINIRYNILIYCFINNFISKVFFSFFLFGLFIC